MPFLCLPELNVKIFSVPVFVLNFLLLFPIHLHFLFIFGCSVMLLKKRGNVVVYDHLNLTSFLSLLFFKKKKILSSALISLYYVRIFSKVHK